MKTFTLSLLSHLSHSLATPRPRGHVVTLQHQNPESLEKTGKVSRKPGKSRHDHPPRVDFPGKCENFYTKSHLSPLGSLLGGEQRRCAVVVVRRERVIHLLSRKRQASESNEQWRVRWAAAEGSGSSSCGDEQAQESWERFGVLDTDSLRSKAERLRAHAKSKT